jgi:hypothetical protein
MRSNVPPVTNCESQQLTAPPGPHVAARPRQLFTPLESTSPSEAAHSAPALPPGLPPAELPAVGLPPDEPPTAEPALPPLELSPALEPSLPPELVPAALPPPLELVPAEPWAGPPSPELLPHAKVHMRLANKPTFEKHHTTFMCREVCHPSVPRATVNDASTGRDALPQHGGELRAWCAGSPEVIGKFRGA